MFEIYLVACSNFVEQNGLQLMLCKMSILNLNIIMVKDPF